MNRRASLATIARCAIRADFKFVYLFAGALLFRKESGLPMSGTCFAESSALKNGSSLKPSKPAVKTAGKELRAVL